jgi:hypothetical protein
LAVGALLESLAAIEAEIAKLAVLLGRIWRDRTHFEAQIP